MLVFGLYLLTGLITIYVATIMHLVIAEKKGYAAVDFWYTNGKPMLEAEDNLGGSFMIGLIIWPVRLVQFALDTPYYYDMYEEK